jgi:hypothetical protein
MVALYAANGLLDVTSSMPGLYAHVAISEFGPCVSLAGVLVQHSLARAGAVKRCLCWCRLKRCCICCEDGIHDLHTFGVSAVAEAAVVTL